MAAATERPKRKPASQVRLCPDCGFPPWHPWMVEDGRGGLAPCRNAIHPTEVLI